MGKVRKLHVIRTPDKPKNELPPLAREVSKPVWAVKDKIDPSFQHRIYVMYHSTRSVEAVKSILENHFTPSVSGVLGPGVYVSRDYRKAYHYGSWTFKLLVYPGNYAYLDHTDPTLIKEWQKRGYDSAWLPPDSDNAGRLEENCIKETKFIRILGLCQGFDHLPDDVKNMVSGVDKQQTPLSSGEELTLKHFLRDLELTDKELDARMETLIEEIETTMKRLHGSGTLGQSEDLDTAVEIMRMAAEELRESVARAVTDDVMQGIIKQAEAAHAAVIEEELRAAPPDYGETSAGLLDEELEEPDLCEETELMPTNEEPVAGPSGLAQLNFGLTATPATSPEPMDTTSPTSIDKTDSNIDVKSAKQKSTVLTVDTSKVKNPVGRPKGSKKPAIATKTSKELVGNDTASSSSVVKKDGAIKAMPRRSRRIVVAKRTLGSKPKPKDGSRRIVVAKRTLSKAKDKGKPIGVDFVDQRSNVEESKSEN